MLSELLKERNLPKLKTKQEMLDILQREEYGYLPQKPESISFTETDNYILNFCAGKAISKKVVADIVVNEKKFSFPFYVTIPKKEGKQPFFICINFRDCVPDRYIPVEEIIDNGYAVLSFCYNDVTKDNGDFCDGLAGILFENGKREESSPGKIALWAWAAQRVMDYAEKQENLDMNVSIVCGHSRLGKTALFTAATDERFRFAFSNDSGCGGAAITRSKNGEKVSDICKTFPYWFCENYKKYINNEEKMPFDQHFLASCIAPRYVYISSAIEDTWADPLSEMLTCVSISHIYEENGMKGFICDDIIPTSPVQYHEGCVGYHLRPGLHYFSREDWLNVIKFINGHTGK